MFINTDNSKHWFYIDPVSNNDIDIESVSNFLTLGYFQENKTLFKNILFEESGAHTCLPLIF